ncbi:hypothetical protein MNBD_UNCLBAC01-767 [hydrothermal vent metagenome]|uniref:Uncharacterized protein n=1 Tax=hydrothermal vent metagenome TaxID=652676 RepID=A0A3B1E409_9ZZZZ
MKKQIKIRLYKVFIHYIVSVFFLTILLTPLQGYSQNISYGVSLPSPGQMVPLSQPFSPVLVKGLKVFPNNPLRFDFVIDKGESGLEGENLKEETERLVKYFLSALTVPEEDLWVNLSPYEKDRIVPNEFGQTEMGRDLLAQDYVLKQLTSSLMYPEDELGEEFWDGVFEKAYDLYGTTEIPINTFNKVWIVPDVAGIYVNGNTAFIVDSHLKVFHEEDYLAMKMNFNNEKYGTNQLDNTDVGHLNALSSEVLKNVILPAIEEEINKGENFAVLRQIYHSVILATWFKRNLKKSLLSSIYVDQNKITGIDVDDKKVNEKIYQQYLDAFKVGVFDFVRDDFEPATQKIIPRRYFSGGTSFVSSPIEERSQKEAMSALGEKNNTVFASVQLDGVRSPPVFTEMSPDERVAWIFEQFNVLTIEDIKEISSVKRVFILLKLIMENSEFKYKKFLQREIGSILQEENPSIRMRQYRSDFAILTLVTFAEGVISQRQIEEVKSDVMQMGQYALKTLNGRDSFMSEKLELIHKVYLKFNLFEEYWVNSTKGLTDPDVREKLKEVIDLKIVENLDLIEKPKYMNPFIREMNSIWFRNILKNYEDFFLERGEVEERFRPYLVSFVTKETSFEFFNKLKNGKIEPQTKVTFWTIEDGGKEKKKQMFQVDAEGFLRKAPYGRGDRIILEPGANEMVSYESSVNISHNPLPDISLKYFPKEEMLVAEYSGGKKELNKKLGYGRFNIVLSGEDIAPGKKGVFRIAKIQESTRVPDVHGFFVFYNLGIGSQIFYWGETENKYYYEYVEEVEGPTLVEYSEALTGEEIEAILALGTVLIQNGIDVQDVFDNPENIMIKQTKRGVRAYIVDPGGIRMKSGFSVKELARIYKETIGAGFGSKKWAQIDPESQIANYFGQIGDIGEKAFISIKYVEQDSAEEAKISSSAVKNLEHKKGGIDLSSSKIDLQIQGQDISFNLPFSGLPCLDKDADGECEQVDLKKLEGMNIQGFKPIIFQMVPINNFPFLLGEGPVNSKSREVLNLSLDHQNNENSGDIAFYQKVCPINRIKYLQDNLTCSFT